MERYPYIFRPTVNDDILENSCTDYYKWGQFYEQCGDNKKAIAHYQLSHSQQNINATYKLAEHNLMYNHQKAEKYLIKSCEKGIVYAILNLGIFYVNKQQLLRAESVIESYPINSFDSIIPNVDEKHHNVIYYFLGIKFEKRKEIEMATYYYLQSYKLNFTYGLQKLIKLVKNAIELFKMFKRENVPILNNNPLFSTFSQIKKCNHCELVEICKPYGYLSLCKKCIKISSKTPAEMLYECYEECCNKFCLKQFINRYGGTIEKSFIRVKTVSNTNDYSNEIVYVKQRQNNALFAQILNVDCETYTQKVKLRATLQMLHYIAKVEMNERNDNEAMGIYKIALNNYEVFGKIANNIGYLHQLNKTYDESLKYYLIAYETGLTIASNIANIYHELNDAENKLQYAIKSIHDNYSFSIDYLMNICKCDEIVDEILFNYLENGQIFLLSDMRMYITNDYRFYKILSRITNKHRLVKDELKKISQFDKCNVGECNICFDENKLLMPLKCGHAFCNDCVVKIHGINGKCPYRCKTVL